MSQSGVQHHKLCACVAVEVSLLFVNYRYWQIHILFDHPNCLTSSIASVLPSKSYEVHTSMVLTFATEHLCAGTP